MVRLLVDRFRRIEVLLLAAGALVASVLMALNAGKNVAALLEGDVPPVQAAVYALKLMMMEAALLAPFFVLVLLSRALLRETSRHRYRWAGMAISLLASAGVVSMLVTGLIPVDLEEAMDTLIGSVVPALVLLSTCALLYGGLIWVAQHGRLEKIMPAAIERPKRRKPD